MLPAVPSVPQVEKTYNLAVGNGLANTHDLDISRLNLRIRQ